MNYGENKYGYCSRCGAPLAPVFFLEEEYSMCNGVPIKTGRKRTAVSHLVCTQCLENEICDDSFDGPWRYGI